VREAAYQLHRIAAFEVGESLWVEINADIAQRRRFALHNRAAAQVRFNVGIVRRHHGKLSNLKAEIGHLKILMETPNGQVAANATTIGAKPEVRACAEASAGTASLIVNARAHIDPRVLNSIVEESIPTTAGEKSSVSDFALRSFKPAYPKPTYRFSTVV
jgi:hypothetical protein